MHGTRWCEHLRRRRLAAKSRETTTQASMTRSCRRGHRRRTRGRRSRRRGQEVRVGKVRSLRGPSRSRRDGPPRAASWLSARAPP
eukprot:8014359-Pyramimonas_sp.AAC.1